MCHVFYHGSNCSDLFVAIMSDIDSYANITSALILYNIYVFCTSICIGEAMLTSLSILLFGRPAAPNAPQLSVSAKLNGLEVSCSSGDQDTYCNVTIQMNGAVQSVAANTTFNGLTSNMMYPISARAINRCGDYSETSASQWTCKA